MKEKICDVWYWFSSYTQNNGHGPSTFLIRNDEEPAKHLRTVSPRFDH